jgi:L-aminopeptidase/D-esterase-like protein
MIAAVELELADGEIDHLGADHAEVEHVRAAVRRASITAAPSRATTRACRARRRSARLELLDVRAPIAYAPVLVELVEIHPAHVVRLEHLRIEHGVPC